jgi:peptide/nickel transport system permease protein
MLAITFVAFGIIVVYESVNGNFLDRCRLNPTCTEDYVEAMTKQLGLDKPWYVRYATWLQGIAISTNATSVVQDEETGEQVLNRWEVWSIQHFTVPLVNLSIPYPSWNPYFGESFETRRPVSDLFWEMLPLTLLLTVPVFFFVWIVSLPIGIYSATHQYSLGDHAVTFFGFVGLSIPNFFLALILLYFLAEILNVGSICTPLEGREYCLGVAGLFNPIYSGGSPWPWNWSFGKFLDYAWHMWPIVLVIGTSAMATLIRILRSSMLDILASNYIKTAQAKGLSSSTVTWKHAFRNAMNPLVSVFGQLLPFLIQGALVTAIVFSVPSIDLLYFNALRAVDEYVIVTVLSFYGFVLLLGNFISDLLLGFVDPRIRYE